MGVFEKLKNALFEVEYVEVDDTPKETKKKNKEKIKEKKDHDKPIAKKIVLPGKREQKVEELKEEELKTDNFEVRPLDEEVKEKPKEEFKFMDDNDFKVDDEEPRIVEVMDSNHEEEPIYGDEPVVEEKSYVEEVEEFNQSYQQNAYHDYYKTKPKESRPYGMDSSYTVPVHEYGTYDKRDEKSYFRPSPIISPIYGILDKNYRKEDVVQKKEVHLSSNFTRGNVSVDDVRDKAYGKSNVEEEKKVVDSKFEVEEEEEENKLVDLNDKDKPEVKEVTMGDALEYFQDLGLEYNVDYVDVSKDKNKKNVKEETPIEETKKPVNETKKEIDYLEEDSKPKTVKVKDEGKHAKDVEIDDDNLFDLIDSMYQEEE